MKKLLLVVLAALLVGIVEAQEAAYVVKNSINVDPNYVSVLEDLGFDVTVITDTQIPSTDFGPFHVLVVGEGYFFNYADLPITNKEALISNTYHVQDWHIAKFTGTVSVGNNYLKGKVVDNSTSISQGFYNPIKLYNSYGIQASYLPKLPDRATGIKNIIGTDNFDQYPFIGVMNVGASRYGGGTASAKTAYYGITETDEWTPESETLFRNTLIWLTAHYNFPVFENISAEVLNNSSARVSVETLNPANVTIRYGKTTLDQAVSNTTFAQNHAITITGLQEDTTYQYQVTICSDADICKNSTIGIFTTFDFTAPILVSSLEYDLTNNSIKLNFTLNEPAYLSLYLDGILDGSSGQAIASFSHSLNGLQEDTEYAYFLELCDESTNCRNTPEFHFTTLDYTPPESIENLSAKVSGSNIRLTWSHDGTDVDHYNIYLADSADGFNFTMPDSTSSTTNYTDATASSTDLRYYAVRAEDASGNEENNAYIVAKVNLDLDAGTNLVTIPLIPTDTRIDVVMHQNGAYHPVSRITAFDAGTQMLKSSDFNVTWQGQVTDIYPLQGYFLQTKQDTTFTLTGTPIVNESLHLNKGMNLVGLTLGETKSISSLPNSIEEVSQYQNGFDIATRYAAGWYNPANISIEPKQGYWVKANADAILVIS